MENYIRIDVFVVRNHACLYHKPIILKQKWKIALENLHLWYITFTLCFLFKKTGPRLNDNFR